MVRICTGLPSIAICRRVDGQHAKERQRQFGAPGTKQPGDAHDFAGIQVERNILKGMLAFNARRASRGGWLADRA